MFDGIKEGVSRLGRRGVFEQRGLLAMSMATAAVVANFTWPNLMPRLSHVQDHAVFVQRLERERYIGRDLGQEAGVRVAVWVEGLLGLRGRTPPLALLEFAHRDFREDAQALAGVVVELPAGLRAVAAVGC